MGSLVGESLGGFRCHLGFLGLFGFNTNGLTIWILYYGYFCLKALIINVHKWLCGLSAFLECGKTPEGFEKSVAHQQHGIKGYQLPRQDCWYTSLMLHRTAGLSLVNSSFDK